MKELLKGILFPFCFCLILATTTVFRCSGDWIRTGDSKFTVKRLCGEPLDMERTGWSQWKNTERWVYGPRGGCYYFLHFKGDQLIKIEFERR